MLLIGLAVTASAILVPSLAQAADPPKKLDASAARELDDQAALLEETTGCDVVPHVLVGRQPAAEILAFARQVGAQLIALTSGESHGSWPFAKGVAAKVLRGSDVPVLVVRSKAS
jgi:nucleotide-binding universal stress UspA family protein